MGNKTLIFLYISALCYSLIDCNNYNKSKYSNFSLAIFDTLQYNNNKLSQIIKPNSLFILYSTNGDCSQCIMDLISFIGIKNNEPYFDNLSCIYLVNTTEKEMVEFYLNKFDIKIPLNDILIIDPEHLFHQLQTEEYQGNQILLFHSSNLTTCVKIPFFPIYNKSDKTNLIKSIKKAMTFIISLD